MACVRQQRRNAANYFILVTARGKTTPSSTAGSFTTHPARKSRTQPEPAAEQPVAPFKIVAVTDTRDFMEHDDRWVPIPGSGDARECDRCGRTHEIHATIEDANGGTFTVGVGCADADDAAAKQMRSTATREAKNAAKAARQHQASERLTLLIHEVEAIDFPQQRIRHVTITEGPWTDTWDIDGVAVRGFPGSEPAERLRCLESLWRRDQAVALVGGADELRSLCRQADARLPWL